MKRRDDILIGIAILLIVLVLSAQRIECNILNGRIKILETKAEQIEIKK